MKNKTENMDAERGNDKFRHRGRDRERVGDRVKTEDYRRRRLSSEDGEIRRLLMRQTTASHKAFITRRNLQPGSATPDEKKNIGECKKKMRERVKGGYSVQVSQ